jgi:hypothetical protein
VSSTRRVAAVATVTIAAAAVVSAVLVMRTPSPQELTKSDGHAAVFTKDTPRGTATSVARGPRVIPPIFGIVFAALAATALAHRRRVGDAGESWRALLLGAPPMRA